MVVAGEIGKVDEVEVWTHSGELSCSLMLENVEVVDQRAHLGAVGGRRSARRWKGWWWDAAFRYLATSQRRGCFAEAQAGETPAGAGCG